MSLAPAAAATARTSTSSSCAAPSTGVATALWADKYKPQSVEHMCYPVCAKRLQAWLEAFPSNLSNPKATKAALLSGPPGVGKTTSVYLVAKALGRSVIEYNASDFRSQKSLHEAVSSVVNNRVFRAVGSSGGTGAAPSSGQTVDNGFILLMDEVDGCDKGGVAEVIQMIKLTKIPILCTCNDRFHPKLRSLLNYVEDIRFTRPPCNIVANFICDRILAREGVSLSKQLLQDIIKESGSDIRSILNNLQMWCLKRNTLDQRSLASCAKASEKNAEASIFESAELFLMQGSSSGEGPKSVNELLSAYYNAELVDLFVQENYLHFQPAEREWLAAVAAASSSISAADALQRIMYVEQNWAVSNAYVLLSSILPCALTRGHYQSFVSGQAAAFDRQRPVKFPSWLGQNSSFGKQDRLLTTLCKEAGNPNSGVGGTKSDLVLDYVPLVLADRLTVPMVEKQKEGIPEVTSIMDTYRLQRDDWDFIQDVAKFRRMETQTLSQMRRGGTDPSLSIATAVKSAFTREFNKAHKTLSYAKESLKHVAAADGVDERAEAMEREADGVEESGGDAAESQNVGGVGGAASSVSSSLVTVSNSKPSGGSAASAAAKKGAGDRNAGTAAGAKAAPPATASGGKSKAASKPKAKPSVTIL